MRLRNVELIQNNELKVVYLGIVSEYNKPSDEFYDISDAHENYESLTEECGFAFVNELEAKQVVLVFEDLSAYSYVDAKQYLSVCEKP